jgi:uncharacterized membrane protein SpoIIM required for sporulation
MLMRERDFIKNNATKWNKFEKLENSGTATPQELSDLYIELTDDLSFSRTHYANRSVRVYLNTLAQRAFNKVQKRRLNTLNQFATFIKTGLPLESYAARYSFLWSFIIFMLALLVGVVSQHIDPDFLGVVVGDGYLEKTKEFIAEGDPMKVYKSGNGLLMSSSIALNNIRVSFLLFILGLTFGVGTSLLLILNGIMLGSFQYFFVQQGVGEVSFLAIWIHGALEISAIVVAGGAGLLLGKGVAFPGTLTRAQSAQIAAKKGVKIMVGLLPVFLVAAFLEGYVTRLENQLPNAVQWFIILGSFAFIIVYFVFYPLHVARKHGVSDALEQAPQYIERREIELHKIKDMSDVFNDTFAFLRWCGGAFRVFLFTIVLPLNFLYCTYLFYFGQFSGYVLDFDQILPIYFSTEEYFDWTAFGVLNLFFTLTTAFVYFAVQQYKISREKLKFGGYFGFLLKHGWRVLLFVFPLLLMVSYLPIVVNLLLLFVVPFFAYWIYAGIDKRNFLVGVSQSFSYSTSAWGLNLGNMLIFSFIGFFGFLYGVGIINEVLIDQTINWFVYEDGALNQSAHNIATALLYTTVFYFFIALLLIAVTLTYYSVEEKISATSLFRRIEDFGKASERRRKDEGDF